MCPKAHSSPILSLTPYEVVSVSDAKMILSSLFVLAVGAVPAAASNPWVEDFQNLVAFGDSYTDESRLSYFFQNNGSAPPPGLLLPASNSTAGGGITWPRWVSNYSGASLYNYAVSGAVCDNKIILRYPDGSPLAFPDVVYEVDAFEADVAYVNASTGTNTLYTNRTADNTVYSMWIGTNDLGNNAFLTDSGLDGAVVTDYVDCVFDRLDGLYENGGRYFVLMLTAPLELSPLYGMPDAGGLTYSHYWPDKPSNVSEVSNKIKEYTQLVNSIFDYRVPFERLIANRYPRASIAIFDVHSLMTDIYYNPTKYLSSPANVTGSYISCQPDEACPKTSNLTLDHFLWYDELHPSERTDQVIAEEFVKVVDGSSDYATYW
ncbi:gdsl lipase acylhydrolase family protein [Phlyctema vagabunda]|uniref:Gdsl lipase acylhydrolase family protein n=1 Tax=Phlyctema vagabunda TaxID=108571 RepID=A0ABR4PCN2_9HELO